jgi:hypothetical protein
MARPERKTVDYFPHFISEGKKMYFIEHKYGNDGYSTWFKLLESLAITEDHFLNLNNESDLMFMSAKCKIEEDLFLNILNDLSKLGEINSELWKSKIVWSEKFTQSIQDAYTRRNNKCMTYEGLCMHLLSLGITLTPQTSKKDYNNTESRVEYTKEDNISAPTKVGDIDFSILLETLNKIFERKFAVVSDAVKKKYKTLLKQGYTKTHIHTAMLNCKKDAFHRDNDYKHCTIEYFSRPKTIDLYGTELVTERKGIVGTYTIHDHL